MDLHSKYGGYYANSIPFDCANKEFWIIATFAQLLLGLLLYSYHIYELKKSNSVRVYEENLISEVNDPSSQTDILSHFKTENQA